MKASAVIEQALLENTGWPAIRAVEAALATGIVFDYDAVLAGIEHDVEEVKGLRVGVLRIKAHRVAPEDSKQTCFDGLRSILHDHSATDRLFALETLCKLGESELPEDQASVNSIIEDVGEAAMPFVLWYRLDSQRDTADQALIRLLDSESGTTRLRAAYVLRRLGPLSGSQWASVKAAAQAHPEDRLAAGYVIAAAYVLAPNPDETARIRNHMLRNFNEYPASAQAEVARSLSVRSDPADMVVLAGWLDHTETAVRLAAAESILLMLRPDIQPVGEQQLPVTDEDNSR